MLDPNDDASLIGQVRLAVDGDTKMPLRVQVFDASDELVFEVGYDSVSFTRPEDREFEFKSAAGDQGDRGASRSTPRTPDRRRSASRRARKAEQAREHGQDRRTGWSTVVVSKPGCRPDGSGA